MLLYKLTWLFTSCGVYEYAYSMIQYSMRTVQYTVQIQSGTVNNCQTYSQIRNVTDIKLHSCFELIHLSLIFLFI